MKKAVPFIRLLFLILFFVLLKSRLLLVWLGIYGLSLIFPLLFGKRLYCMLACPMNTLIVWVTRLKQKLGWKNHPVPKWLAGGRLPWISLALTLAVFIITRRVVGKDFPMMVIWMVISVFLTLFHHQDMFHDQVCPFGAPQGCLAKRSLLSEEGREKARNYQGFTASVLGGGPKAAPRENARKS